jgi:hypothetical protein
LVVGSDFSLWGQTKNFQNFQVVNQPTVVLVRFEGSTFETVENDSIPIVAFNESFYDVNARVAFSIKYFPLELFLALQYLKYKGNRLNQHVHY